MSLTPMNPGNTQDRSEADMDQTEKKAATHSRTYGILLALALIIGTGEAFYAAVLSNRLEKVQSDIRAQQLKQDDAAHNLANRLGITEDQFADLQGDLSSTKDHLGKTQVDLRKARQMADQLAKEQKETADNLTGQLGALQEAQVSTSGAVGNLSTDVTGVKQEVSTTKQDLASTRSDLQRVIGDLGVQSGLVATNRSELAELRLRGERDYFEFDLRKTKQPQKYTGGVALQLKKTDVKRQKYTMDLISDDRRIEKKDKNTNEPVQFYQQGQRIPAEIVVNQILKDRIVGYISVPKVKDSRVSGLQSTAQPSGSGS